MTAAGMEATLGHIGDRLVTDGIPHSTMVHHIEVECERIGDGVVTRHEVRLLSRCYILLIFYDFFSAGGEIT